MVRAGVMRRWTGWRIAGVVLACLGGRAVAQDVYKDVEHLDPDRPEAWASFYYTSVTLLSGLSIPEERTPGSVEIGIELGRIPQLSESERTVGFNGTKEEDFNKAPLFARPRLMIGLPWRTTLILSYLLPVRVFGLKPNLFAAALEWPLARAGAWRFGARAYGQLGNVQGAFTCPDDVVEEPLGSEQNPFGCEEQSTDRAYQRYLGLELSVARRVAGFERLDAYLTLAGNYLDTTEKIHAQTYGQEDRSRLEAQQQTWSAQAGLVYRLDERVSLGVGVFYTPLDVVRWPSTETVNDPLINLRGMLSYRL
jgi:hypothetical protein